MHPGMVIMHPRMVTIASRDGDLEMAIDASREGDRCIPGWRSMHPGIAIDASRDGDHCIQGWRSRDDHRCIPGWRSQYPWMAIVFIPVLQ